MKIPLKWKRHLLIASIVLGGLSVIQSTGRPAYLLERWLNGSEMHIAGDCYSIPQSWSRSAEEGSNNEIRIHKHFDSIDRGFVSIAAYSSTYESWFQEVNSDARTSDLEIVSIAPESQDDDRIYVGLNRSLRLVLIARDPELISSASIELRRCS